MFQAALWVGRRLEVGRGSVRAGVAGSSAAQASPSLEPGWQVVRGSDGASPYRDSSSHGGKLPSNSATPVTPDFFTCGGRGGIRTHGTVTRTPDFESAKSPR